MSDIDFTFYEFQGGGMISEDTAASERASDVLANRRVVGGGLKKNLPKGSKAEWVKELNPFPIELNPQGFFNNVRTVFLQQLEKLQQEYIMFIDGIYNGAKFIFEGTPKLISTGLKRLIGEFKARVEDKQKFYLAYVEWGTGTHRSLPGFTNQMMEDALGNPGRGITLTIEGYGKITKRPVDGLIIPRGAGHPWTDPGGTEHPGANYLFIPDKDPPFSMWTKGVEPKHELRKQTESFLTPGRLHLFICNVYSIALGMPGSYKAGGKYIEVRKQESLEDFKAAVSSLKARAAAIFAGPGKAEGYT